MPRTHAGLLVLLMRHGPAETRDETVYPDDQARPLTADGRKKTRAAAQGLAALDLVLDRVVTSPLVRAAQTADIAASVFQIPVDRRVESRHLAPGGSPAALLSDLAAHADDKCVLLVGHEPDLSRMASWLIAGDADAAGILMKKAAVCGIEIDAAPPARRGVLRFLLQPGQLRALAKPR